jgi:hypothetical protein
MMSATFISLIPAEFLDDRELLEKKATGAAV